jgi:hypothetical protein
MREAQMSNILERDLINVNMLLTEDLYPMPAEAIIVKHMGNDKVLLTDAEGAVLQVIAGQHMIIEIEAISFVEWIKGRSFWLFDSEKNKFQNIKLKVVE